MKLIQKYDNENCKNCKEFTPCNSDYTKYGQCWKFMSDVKPDDNACPFFVNKDEAKK